MTNRYQGTCRRCGQAVAPGAGTCEKINGKWVVEHTTCPEPETVTLPDDWEAVQAAGKPNQVNRTCCRCGREVGIGDGLCARSASGQWYTWHSECPEEQAVRPRAQVQAQMRTYSTSPRSDVTYDLHPMDPLAERLS